MSARRRRFNEPSPVDFGPALLGESPQNGSLDMLGDADDRRHHQFSSNTSSIELRESMDTSAATFDNHQGPHNEGDSGRTDLTSSISLQQLSGTLIGAAPKRSSSFKNLVTTAAATTPRRPSFNSSNDGGESILLRTPPPSLATKDDDAAAGGEHSVLLFTPLKIQHKEEEELIGDVHPQNRRLPPLTNHSGRLPRRESPEPSFGAHNNISASVRVPPVASAKKSSEISFPSELCCPVCLDPFQTPVTLSCSHNVCHEHILDLAAAAAPGGVLPRGEGGVEKQKLQIHCPKCREMTVFAQGMQSVHTNLEMKALVDMMVVMLSQQQQLSMMSSSPPPHANRHAAARKSGNTTPNSFANNVEGEEGDVSATNSRPQSGRSASRERGGAGKHRAVRFTEEIVLDDGPGEHSVLLSGGATPLLAARTPLTPHSVLKKPTAPPEGSAEAEAMSGSPSVASARKLENQLRLQREKLREEREKQAKEKLEEFKRQRREDIEKRKEEAERSEALIARQGDLPSPPVALQSFDDETDAARLRPPGSSSQRRERVWEHRKALHRNDQRASDDDDLAEEDMSRRNLQLWLAEGDDVVTSNSTTALPTAGRGGVEDNSDDVLSRHLRQLQLYEAGGGLAPPPSQQQSVLTASTKARKAEERIQHLFRPLEIRSQEDRMKEREQARRDRELELEKQYEAPDEEVELKLWDVERRVLREHDEELSRQQMAEIAEARARAQIAAFRKQAAGGGVGKAPVVAKASYIPKIQRLQKF